MKTKGKIGGCSEPTLTVTIAWPMAGYSAEQDKKKASEVGGVKSGVRLGVGLGWERGMRPKTRRRRKTGGSESQHKTIGI